MKFIIPGISEEFLIKLGLEYKYLTWYLTGSISYDKMVEELGNAIKKFAKRQMTWLRRYKDALTVYGDGRSAEEIYEDAESLLFSAGFFER